MENKVTQNIVHIARSHHQLARILAAKKEVVKKMGFLIDAVPDHHDAGEAYDVILENGLGVTKSLTSYLSGLADLEEALSFTLMPVLKEINADEGE